MTEPRLTKEEFCARFKAHMLKHAGRSFIDSGIIAEYADEIAPSYYDGYYVMEPFSETPEDCADSDMDYWGEE